MVQNNLTYDCLWLGVGCCVHCRGLQIITATQGAHQLPGGGGLAENKKKIAAVLYYFAVKDMS